MFLTTVKSTTSSIESVVFVSHVEFFSFTHCDTFFHHSFIHSSAAAIACFLLLLLFTTVYCSLLVLLYTTLLAPMRVHHTSFVGAV